MKKTILVQVFLLLMLSLSSCKQEENKNITNNAEEEFISFVPPIKEADIKFEEFKIDPSKDTIIYHSSGTEINIPKNAFLNANGEVIKEKVDLKFRTFSNPLETYLAGIPMTYSMENGEEMVFESAGMFEIDAYLPEEKVFVNPNNKISVSMVSFTKEDKFKTYDLDSNTKKWVETGKDKINETSKEDALKNAPNIPEPPRKAGKFAFQIEDVYNTENSLKDYKNVWFEPIDGKEVGFDSKDILVKDLKNGTYEITFVPWVTTSEKLPNKTVCVLAFKDNESYSNAMKAYQKKYESQIKIAQRERDKIEREWNAYEKKLRVYNTFMAKKSVEGLSFERRITRTMQVNNFGFVNCDYPTSYPSGAKIHAIYVDSNNKEIKLHDIVMIEKGRNALYRYMSKIRYNPEKENLLWGITEEGKLAYFTPEDFNKIDLSKKEAFFRMRIHTTELKTYDEIMSVLFPDK